MSRSATGWLGTLRPHTYVAAPHEPVLLPMITSTLFLQLPRAYRHPFRIGMAILLAGLIALSGLNLLAPLVALVALGVPALFVLYLWQSGVTHDIPGHAFALSAGLGAAFGTGWVWITGKLVARAYGVPMAAGLLLENLADVGLIIALGGAVLMMLPAVAVRILIRLRRGPREALDGFTIGALGALSFTAAATTTRLAPQFVSGLLNNVLPMRRLTGAVLYGLAAPLTATALGGLVGILLWFHAGPIAAQRRGHVRAIVLLFTLLVGVVYTAIWLIDESPLPRWPQLALHILMTAIALLAARFCVQLALLHERQPDPKPTPVLCPHCEHVVPDMAFCPACGFAVNVLSRRARRQRRDRPPTRQEPRSSADV